MTALKKHMQTAKVLILAIILTLGLNYAHAQWVGPTAAAPGNNAAAPLNVGASGQAKAGPMSVNGVTLPAAGHALDVYGDLYADQVVGTLHYAVGAGGGYVINSRSTNTPDAQWYSGQNNLTSLWSHRINENVVNINTQTKTVDVLGKVSAETLQVTGGAAAGSVLTATDNAGNAAWQNVTVATQVVTAVAPCDGTAMAMCPAGTHVTGGGISIPGGAGFGAGYTFTATTCNGQSPEIYFTQSYPSGNGWLCGADDYAATCYAVCTQ